MKNDLVSKLRRLQMIVSSIAFVLIAVLCYNVTGFNITEIQLSEWGNDSSVGWLWNGMIMVVSLVLAFNVIVWIKRHQRLKFKKHFYVLFTLMSFLLFIVGLFPASAGLIHTAPAFIFFFSYPLIIFTMAFVNRRNIQYTEWLRHLMISIFMITIPLMSMTFFTGFAIPEILHIVILIYWNLSLLKPKRLITHYNDN